MKKVFVSYCSKNKELVEMFMEFLQLGMGVHKSDIFCTAYSEMLRTGGGFIDEIRDRLQECEVVISIITEEYLESAFCLVEMGAAWAMSKQFFPMLTVPYSRLNGTPLQNMQMRKMSDIEDMSVIYDELHFCGVLKEYQTAEFNKRVSEFTQGVECLNRGQYVLQKDKQGYYETTIESVRQLRDKQYRCYGIRGHIADPPDGGTADSDWLFYYGGAFQDLTVGDRVRFKTTKSKVNTFPDLGKARNIYPDDLKKIQ